MNTLLKLFRQVVILVKLKSVISIQFVMKEYTILETNNLNFNLYEFAFI